MKKLLTLEQPDFVAVTGDCVSGYAWDGKTQGWYKEQYLQFTRAMIEANASWALTAGNHDTQADLTREQISELDRTF